MTLYQSTPIEESKLNALLKKYGESTIQIDKSSVEHGITILEDKINAEALTKDSKKSRLRGKSYTEILKYLDGLMSKSDKRVVEKLKFRGASAGIVGTPLINAKVDELETLGIKLEYTDYIVHDNSATIVRINYNNVMNGLALELAKDDLGYTMEESESILENASLVIPNNSKLLDEFICGDNLEKIVPGMRIGESSYFDPVKKKAFSYYLDSVSDIFSYAGMMSATSKRTMTLIVCNLLNELDLRKYDKVSLLAVYNNELVFEILEDVEGVAEVLSSHVNVQIMGRKFKFHPNVQVIEGEG